MTSIRNAGSTVMRPGDRSAMTVFVTSFVLASVITLALPFLLDHVAFYDSVAALCAPFVAVAVWCLVSERKWFRIVIPAVVSVALCLWDWRVGAISVMVTLGSTGISYLTGLLQRRLFLGALDCVEHCNVRDRTFADRLIAFLFNIPPDLDTRDLRINGAVHRESLRWTSMVDILIPAMVPMLFLWMFAAVGFGSSHGMADVAMPVTIAVMYILAFTLPWSIFRTLDVRVKESGSVFRVYDGLIGTFSRMIVPAVIGLGIVLFAAEPGWGSVVLMAISALFCIVLMVLSMVAYMMDQEADLVEVLAEHWYEDHPVDFYCGFDGKDGKHPLDDGVPGTPRRPADECFPTQK